MRKLVIGLNLILLCAFLCMFNAQAQTTTPAPTDAIEFVKSRYAEHYKKGQGFSEDDLKARRDWFTPQLYRLLFKDMHEAAVRGDVGNLEADPFTNAQDDSDGFSIGKTRMTAGKAIVNVDVQFGQVKRPVTLVLMKAGGKWQIDNIVYSPSYNLQGLLKNKN